MLSRLGKKIHHLRTTISRSEWAAKHLHLRHHGEEEHGVNAPGVLMLQVDGLSYDNLLHAIDRNTAPFLHSLIQRDCFVLKHFYSGLPSSTPAVQAELFYGVKTAVPAFQYYHRTSAEERTMFDAKAADAVLEQMDKKDKGLLKGGSSYSNIYSGGAAEAPFCIESMRLESLFHTVEPRRVFLFLLFHMEKLIRIIGLSLLEAALAVYDFFKGILLRKNLSKEFKFIFARIGACIVLREIIRLHVKIDLARGLPIIHANLIGYDEHAHRRNPRSAFAHWTLKGIDATIRSLVRKAMKSEKRDYTICIYSDHGQESSIDFFTHAGMTLHEAVRHALGTGKLTDCRYSGPESVIPYMNLHQRSTGLLRKSPSAKSCTRSSSPAGDTIHITAMGPLGHIYLPVNLSASEKHSYAERLVHIAKIPLVLYCANTTVTCVWQEGSGDLKRVSRDIFGGDHPFLGEVTKDMEAVCRHDDAGDFIISGWRTDDRPVTFPLENGSHGGPGPNETHGFAILPDTLAGEQPSLRPLDLRKKVRAVFDNNPPAPVDFTSRKKQVSQTIRVMTYNIHSCIGLDGKLFPSRIARIIERQKPDIIALQEVDRNMERSDNQDQVQLLADQLALNHCYFPVLQEGDSQYGLAVLSRFPIAEEQFIHLPQQKNARPSEKRGAVRITLATPQGPVHLVNTHLSLIRRERVLQMEFIVNGRLLEQLLPTGPLIFCGDLNATRGSAVYSLLESKLKDCQAIYPERKPDATFFSTMPVVRLDHIFHSAGLRPVSIQVIDDRECRTASDHLPVIATFFHTSRMGS